MSTKRVHFEWQWEVQCNTAGDIAVTTNPADVTCRLCQNSTGFTLASAGVPHGAIITDITTNDDGSAVIEYMELPPLPRLPDHRTERQYGAGPLITAAPIQPRGRKERGRKRHRG